MSIDWLTVEEPRTSNWLTVKKLIELAEIEDFEVFPFFRKGLPVYDCHGTRILDTIPRYWPLEHYEDSIRATHKNLSEDIIKALAKSQYKRSGRIDVTPDIRAEGYRTESFTLSTNPLEREQQIRKTMTWWVKIDDALEFAKKQGLKNLERNIIRLLQKDEFVEAGREEPEEELTETEQENNVKGNSKLRPNQKHRIECREIAKKLWEEDQTITIAGMAYRDEINAAFDEKTYADKTIRNWIKDLCPRRSPGRRPKKI